MHYESIVPGTLPGVQWTANIKPAQFSRPSTSRTDQQGTATTVIVCSDVKKKSRLSSLRLYKDCCNRWMTASYRIFDFDHNLFLSVEFKLIAIFIYCCAVLSLALFTSRNNFSFCLCGEPTTCWSNKMDENWRWLCWKKLTRVDFEVAEIETHWGWLFLRSRSEESVLPTTRGSFQFFFGYGLSECLDSTKR